MTQFPRPQPAARPAGTRPPSRVSPLELGAPAPEAVSTLAVRSPGFHPFIFRKMIMGPVDSPWPWDGELVRVVDRDGFPLGFGLWNSRSELRLRLIAPSGKADAPIPGVDWWGERLDRAVRLREGVLNLPEFTDAYRLVHAEGDGLSGFIVDRYESVLSAEIFSLGMYRRAAALLEGLAKRVGTEHWRVHVDDRMAEAEDFPGTPMTSPGCPEIVKIQEHGVRYRVKFLGGHKTGFFCDQRDNRKELSRYCRDRTVLDVCCYAGGFALNALIRGRAKEVTGVDLDEKAIAMARENANLNQVRPILVHSDAFGYLRQMGTNGREFGVVVLDPPKLIATPLDMEIGWKKYLDLNTLALSLVEPGGLLLTCSCSGLLPQEEFLKIIRSAARRAGRQARVLAVTGASPDHPVELEVPEGNYLKAVWLHVGDRTREAPVVE
jgi:23S rRNA (cytosine1962-C5)-methyltransferase